MRCLTKVPQNWRSFWWGETGAKPISPIFVCKINLVMHLMAGKRERAISN